MARTSRDEVQDAVRVRLQEAMVSAGVGHGRVALEVLYWLPQEFVRDYQELYMRALHLGDGDDRERPGKDEGRVKAKVKAAKRGKRGSMEARAKAGKYKKEWVVKDEEALEVKRQVDKKLVELVRREKQKQTRGSSPPSGKKIHGSTPPSPSGGNPPREVVGNLREMAGKADKKVCEDCGKIAAIDWVRCPYPHAWD
jgi:hypothetical protein